MKNISVEVRNKIDNAVNRLNKILPLKQSQLSLTPSMNQLYHEILFSYIEIGRSLNRNEISDRVDDVDEAINIFKEKDLIVFDDTGEPVGAYPFTMESRKHKLYVNNHQLNCMCALDALAVSPMFNKPVEISSRCHVSDEAVYIKQSGFNISNANDVVDVYFGIDWGSASNTCCCANSLCGEMVFLKGNEVVTDWLNADLESRETFKLDEAIEFAAQFFMPILESE